MTSEAHPGDTAAGVTKAGDLVRIDYDLWSEIGGKTELLDTTHEEVAQTANVPPLEGRTWGPKPHQIGGEYFPSGIENSLVGAKIGEEVVREYAPADAFGERDPKLIELFSMHEVERLPEMRREDAHLDVGTVLTIGGRRGRVVSLTAARVRVDFNPPFAGRRVKGTFKVTEKITDPVAQARAILDLQYGRAGEFHIEHREKSFTIKVPDRSKFDIAWMAAKPRVVDRLRSQLHPDSIRFVEEYVTPVAEKKAESPGPKEASESGIPATEPVAAGATPETASAKPPKKASSHAKSTPKAGPESGA
jgi:FKBP-type peptidyl-prolyl cis-trans isomerase 2